MLAGFKKLLMQAAVTLALASACFALPARAGDAPAAVPAAEAPAPEDAPRFVLTPGDIAAWRVEDEKMLYFKMTEEKAAAFHVFTAENLNRRVHLYIGDALISSAIVRVPIAGGYGAATLTPASHCALAAYLPPDKETLAKEE